MCVAKVPISNHSGMLGGYAICFNLWKGWVTESREQNRSMLWCRCNDLFLCVSCYLSHHMLTTDVTKHVSSERFWLQAASPTLWQKSGCAKVTLGATRQDGETRWNFATRHATSVSACQAVGFARLPFSARPQDKAVFSAMVNALQTCCLSSGRLLPQRSACKSRSTFWNDSSSLQRAEGQEAMTACPGQQTENQTIWGSKRAWRLRFTKTRAGNHCATHCFLTPWNIFFVRKLCHCLLRIKGSIGFLPEILHNRAEYARRECP